MSFDIEDQFFVSFLTVLQKNKVRYMLIGGIAVNFHGVNRNTQDMDIWLAPTNENKVSFIKTLIDIGYTEEEVADLNNEDFTQIFKCSIGEMPYTIDCLTYVHPSLNFDEAEQNVIKHNIGGDIILNIVDLDYLRKMKVLTHREKDWYDVARLDEIKKQKGN